MMKGDLVHIPQGTLLLRDRKETLWDGAAYIKCNKPIRALFWEIDSKEPRWGFVYYKEKVWSVKMREIYPITQEIENAS
jgi:hypothetical protein